MSHNIMKIMNDLMFIALVVSACQARPTTTEKPTSLPVTATSIQPIAAPTDTMSASGNLRTPLWTYATQGEVWSSPAVADGVVYLGSDDHFLYAVDIATHHLKWKFETGDILRSRPAVDEGTVYFTSDDNYLYALNVQTGQQVWKFDMGKEWTPRQPVTTGWDYLASSPAVSNGVVYVGAANPVFYAVDAMTGQEKWRFQAGYYGAVRSSPAVVNGLVYFGDWSGMVRALDAQTGQEKWSFNTLGPVVPSPTVVDGVVYIGSKYPCVFALDAQTGQKKWCFSYPANIPWVESSAAVADGVVYVGSSDWDRVNALDATTGQSKWSFTTQGDPWCSPAVDNGVVYIGATGGYFYALDAATGTEKWKVRTDKGLQTVDIRFDGGVVSSPVIMDGVVYFGSLDGKLYAVSTAP